MASYFCTPTGQVLHAVAGPVDAAVLRKEARWVVDTWSMAQLERQNDGSALELFFRKAHTERLRAEHGFDVPERVSYFELMEFLDRPENRSLNKQGKVHLLMAAAPLVRIENVYRIVFTKILGEPVSTNPVARL